MSQICPTQRTKRSDPRHVALEAVRFGRSCSHRLLAAGDMTALIFFLIFCVKQIKSSEVPEIIRNDATCLDMFEYFTPPSTACSDRCHAISGCRWKPPSKDSEGELSAAAWCTATPMNLQLTWWLSVMLGWKRAGFQVSWILVTFTCVGACSALKS